MYHVPSQAIKTKRWHSAIQIKKIFKKILEEKHFLFKLVEE